MNRYITEDKAHEIAHKVAIDSVQEKIDMSDVVPLLEGNLNTVSSRYRTTSNTNVTKSNVTINIEKRNYNAYISLLKENLPIEESNNINYETLNKIISLFLTSNIEFFFTNLSNNDTIESNSQFKTTIENIIIELKQDNQTISDENKYSASRINTVLESHNIGRYLENISSNVTDQSITNNQSNQSNKTINDIVINMRTIIQRLYNESIYIAENSDVSSLGSNFDRLKNIIQINETLIDEKNRLYSFATLVKIDYHAFLNNLDMFLNKLHANSVRNIKKQKKHIYNMVLKTLRMISYIINVNNASENLTQLLQREIKYTYNNLLMMIRIKIKEVINDMENISVNMEGSDIVNFMVKNLMVIRLYSIMLQLSKNKTET